MFRVYGLGFRGLGVLGFWGLGFRNKVSLSVSFRSSFSGYSQKRCWDLGVGLSGLAIEAADSGVIEGRHHHPGPLSNANI